MHVDSRCYVQLASSARFAIYLEGRLGVLIANKVQSADLIRVGHCLIGRTGTTHSPSCFYTTNPLRSIPRVQAAFANTQTVCVSYFLRMHLSYISTAGLRGYLPW